MGIHSLISLLIVSIRFYCPSLLAIFLSPWSRKVFVSLVLFFRSLPRRMKRNLSDFNNIFTETINVYVLNVYKFPGKSVSVIPFPFAGIARRKDQNTPIIFISLRNQFWSPRNVQCNFRVFFWQCFMYSSSWNSFYRWVFSRNINVDYCELVQRTISSINLLKLLL